MRRKGKGPPTAQGSPPFATRGVRELERFTNADLQRWEQASRQLDELHSLLYYGPEAQRAAHAAEIVAALQETPGEPIDGGDPWVRIVDYRYADDPLSPVGSLNSIGGRFNVGSDLEEYGHASWPALYLAQDYPTAYYEKFLALPNGPSGQLSGSDLALTRPASFACVNVNVHIRQVFDLRTAAPLEPMIKVIKRFKMDGRVDRLVTSLRLQKGAAYLVATAPRLHAVVMSPHWRQWGMQFDLPSQSQVLARFIAQAGYEAIRYRSCKGQMDCVALLCRNLHGSNSYVELADAPMQSTRLARLDSSCAQNW